jgi:hypothetical protein
LVAVLKFCSIFLIIHCMISTSHKDTVEI